MKSKFQIIVTAIFIIFIVAGVAAFATFRSENSSTSLPPITVWGTIPSEVLTNLIQELNLTRQSTIQLTYVEFKPEEFTQKFVEALARGRGPDAVLIPQELIQRNLDKLQPIPYTSLPERTYRDMFVDQAEVYLTSEGPIAIPFMVDPMVMYWNRDTFTNAGYARQPYYWDEIMALIPNLTQKDVNANIRKTVIGLGEFRNVDHAREILSTLFLQTGNPITAYNQGYLQSTIGAGTFEQSAQDAVNFFTSFSDASSKTYTWNRALPSAKSYFLAGNSALYLGFASELQDIRAKNPNLNFDVSPFPQARTGKNRVAYARMYGFSLVRQSQLQSVAYSVITDLIKPEALVKLTNANYLPPVRRDILAQGTTDPYLSIFYDAALIGRSWRDPDAVKSKTIFQGIVENISSGRETLRDALRKGSDEINLLIQENQ